MSVEQMELMVAALYERMKGAGKGNGNRKGTGKGNEPTRRCVKCGSKDHIAPNCPKPAVAFGERPCYKCGKTGHLARDCKGKAQVNAVEEPDEPVDFGGHVGMVTEQNDEMHDAPPEIPDEGRRPRRTTRPQASKVTFAHFYAPAKNAFEFL